MSIEISKPTAFLGIGVTNFQAYGKIKFLDSTYSYEIKRQNSSPKEERKRFLLALKETVNKTKEIAQSARKTIGEGEAQIFEIHAMLLEDEDFVDCVNSLIETGLSSEEAVEKSGEKYSNTLRALGDEYLSARATDIKDICQGIIDTLQAKKEKTEENGEPYILVAKDLSPSETVKLDKSKILGFVTFEGSATSHTSILAKAMGIPAVVGVGEISRDYENKLALLDGIRGRLIINPKEIDVWEYKNNKAKENKIAKEHERYLRSIMHRPAVTKSGKKILIYANVGDADEVEGAISNGAEGIGLLRSEFMYISRNSLPSEEELYIAYKTIAQKMQGKRVVIRTLDIGADKQAPYLELEREENPALGLRGVRLCLDRQDVFKTQIRAILRASKYGRISIMIPMISTHNELLRCKELIKSCESELKKEGIDFDSQIEIGIMIETPASAIISDVLAKEVDFFSVGTNDLSQYTYAVDRQNSKVSGICEENHEAIMRLIKMSAEAIHAEGGWIGICGEMGADLSLTQELIDMGIDELSVSVPYLLGVRGKVCASN